MCGVFVGYGNDLEITDNVLAANGAITADYEENRRAGLRGGIYVRFAGALTTQLSTSSGRKPALRVHDNRVDQPAGRALTAFAFGPVSIANNHLNSEFTGRFGFIDTAVGGVLVGNLGGIHRLIARLAGGKIDNANRFAALAEAVAARRRDDVRRQLRAARRGEPLADRAGAAVHGRPRLRQQHELGLPRQPVLLQHGADRRHRARHRRRGLREDAHAHDLDADASRCAPT